MKLAFRQKNPDGSFTDVDEEFDLGEEFDILGPWTATAFDRETNSRVPVRISDRQIASLQNNVEADGGVKPLLDNLGLREGADILSVLRAIQRRNSEKAANTMRGQEASEDQDNLFDRLFAQVNVVEVEIRYPRLAAKIVAGTKADADRLAVSRGIDAMNTWFARIGVNPFDTNPTPAKNDLRVVQSDEEEPF